MGSAAQVVVEHNHLVVGAISTQFWSRAVGAHASVFMAAAVLI